MATKKKASKRKASKRKASNPKRKASKRKASNPKITLIDKGRILNGGDHLYSVKIASGRESLEVGEVTAKNKTQAKKRALSYIKSKLS